MKPFRRSVAGSRGEQPRARSSSQRRFALAALPFIVALVIAVPANATQVATTGGASVTAGTFPFYDTVATVNGTADLGQGNGTWSFVYGPDPNQMSSSTSQNSLDSDGQPVSVQSTLSYLRPNTTYYYELEVNTGASLYLGGIASFTTPPGPSPLGML